MSMFCYQCQETTKGIACTIKGICGKTEDVAQLQYLLIYTLKGIAILATQARQMTIVRNDVDEFIMESLFSTITNANFERNTFVTRIQDGLNLLEGLRQNILSV